jgi:drug/metabolite transporter (DMT)-like permease
MQRLLYGPFLIILAAFLWGMDGLLRRSLYSLAPTTIVLFEHLIGLLILLPFFLPLVKKEKFTRKEWGVLVFVALLSSVLGTLWFTAALLKTNYISFSVVFLLQKLQPIFAISGAVLLLKEKVTWKYIAWALVAILAAYFVTFPGGRIALTHGRETIIAALLAVGAAFAWGFSTPFSRYALLKHTSTVVTGWRFALATLFIFVLAFFARYIPALTSFFNVAPLSQQILSLNEGQVWRVVVIALSSGMVALWIYYQGLRHTEAKVATILELASPLTAVILDIAIYHNILTWSQYLAGAVLIYSTWRVSKLNNAA